MASHHWMVPLGFGLIHGVGFAAVLTDLGLPPDSLLLSLVSFNIGVELGQLAIVTAFLPLAYLLRRSWSYPRLVLTGGSLGVIVIALVWVTERRSIFSYFRYNRMLTLETQCLRLSVVCRHKNGSCESGTHCSPEPFHVCENARLTHANSC